MKNKLVETVDCSRAEELLDNLSPRGPWFDKYDLPFTWAFRGHEDDQYELVPSALRQSSRALLESLTDFRCDSNRSQMRAEAQLIHKFFWRSDLCGLPLPEDSQEMRRTIESLNQYVESAACGECSWPPRPLLSLVGLMQHNGLPTRLLDWSRSSLIAAYFAAYGAVTKQSFNQRLSVWAFCLKGPHMGNAGEHNSLCRIERITAPSASNGNLRAQQGLFTLLNPGVLDLDAKVDRKSLDQVLHNYSLPESVARIFFRFTLPAKEADRLLWLLAKEGISGALLFPGPEGVAKEIRETALWPKAVSQAANNQASNTAAQADGSTGNKFQPILMPRADPG